MSESFAPSAGHKTSLLVSARNVFAAFPEADKRNRGIRQPGKYAMFTDDELQRAHGTAGVRVEIIHKEEVRHIYYRLYGGKKKKSHRVLRQDRRTELCQF